MELDLGGIAKGYAVDRVVELLKRAADRRRAGQRRRQHDLRARRAARRGGMGRRRSRIRSIRERPRSPLRLKDRALSVAGSSEKSFEADGVRYSHIMDPRTGRPVQGVLSVAVLATTGTAGDALDDAFFVLGPERSRAYLHRLPRTEVFFFLPDASADGRCRRRGNDRDETMVARARRCTLSGRSPRLGRATPLPLTSKPSVRAAKLRLPIARRPTRHRRQARRTGLGRRARGPIRSSTSKATAAAAALPHAREDAVGRRVLLRRRRDGGAGRLGHADRARLGHLSRQRLRGLHRSRTATPTRTTSSR